MGRFFLLGFLLPGFFLCANAADILALVQPQSQVDERAGGMDVVVARYGTGVGTVSVGVRVVGSGAVLGQDYGPPVPGTLTWADGDLAFKVVHLPILATPGHDPDRYFSLELADPVSAVLDAARPSVNVSILDQDPNPAGRIVLLRDEAQGNIRVADGAGAVTVSVLRTGGSRGSQTLTLACIDQDAQVDVDYQRPAVTTLSWADGEAGMKTLAIPILARSVPRGDRAFAVLWSTSGGGADIDGQGWTITVGDRVPPSAGTVIVPDHLDVEETAGAAVIPVVRSGGTAGAVSVAWSLSDDTAVAGVNYTGPVTGTLAWADGEGGAKNLVIPLRDDGVPHATLESWVFYNNATGGAILNGNAMTTLAIRDGDPQGLLGFTSNGASVAADAGSVTLAIRRQGGTSGAVAADWACLPGTATAGTDYTAVSGTVAWADGDATPRQVTVPILAAPGRWPDRWFNLRLSQPQGGAGLDDNHSWASITVTAPGSGVDGISVESATIRTWRSAGSISLGYRRSGSGAGPAGVQVILTPGTARQGMEFGAPSASVLTWGDGETGTKILTIPILDDGETGPGRDFTVYAGLVYGSARLMGNAATAVTVGDIPPANPTSSGATAGSIADNRGGCGAGGAGVWLIGALGLAGWRKFRGQCAGMNKSYR